MGEWRMGNGDWSCLDISWNSGTRFAQDCFVICLANHLVIDRSSLAAQDRAQHCFACLVSAGGPGAIQDPTPTLPKYPSEYLGREQAKT